MELPRKPAYIYGRETAPNEKVYTETALEEYGRAVQEACARVCVERAEESKKANEVAGEISQNFQPSLYVAFGAEQCAEAIRNGVIREGEGS